ncbi:MAG: PQQ-binding-like beta-propeller repeat protein, partial [Planctomycetota bacterium]
DEAKSKVVGLIPAKAATLASRVSLRALCVDRRSGELLRDVELFRPEQIDVIHSLNSYASPTPVIEAGRLYCHFGTYGNACIDTDTGEVLWRRVIPIDHYVGPGSSPLLHGDLLVLTYDGANEQFITALDKRTGETVWRTDRPPITDTNPDFRKAYSTPIATELNGRTQLVITGAQWIAAYDPASGGEIWRFDHGHGFSTVPRPVERDGVVYFASGFSGEELIALRPTGEGQLADADVVWRSRRQAPTQPSPVLVADRVFTVSDKGIGVCLDAATGEVIWQKRLGRAFSASPLAVGGNVYFFSRDGETTVIDSAADTLSAVAVNDLDGTIMATPAVVDGRMYLRTDTHLYCLGR